MTQETTTAALSLLFIVSAILRWRTGSHILFWLALLFACLEAGVRQAEETLVIAVWHYLRRYPKMLKAVRGALNAEGT